MEQEDPGQAGPFRWPREPENLVAAWNRKHKKPEDVTSNE